MSDAIEAFLELAIVILVNALWVPVADAWLNYGVPTGVFATLVLGLPILLITFSILTPVSNSNVYPKEKTRLRR